MRTQVAFTVGDLSNLSKYFQSTDDFQRTNTADFDWFNISAKILHIKVA